MEISSILKNKNVVMKVSTFEERLKLGNDKELYVNDILNLSGLSSKINNIDNVKDIDLYVNDCVYIDVKYLERVFNDSYFYTDINPCDCLMIDKIHFKNYMTKQRETNKSVWIAFFINFKEFDIFELRFIQLNKIHDLIKKEKAIVRSIKERGRRKMKINLNRNDCLLISDFIFELKKQ